MGPSDAATLQGTVLSSSVSSDFDLESVPPSQGWESRTARPLVEPVLKQEVLEQEGCSILLGSAAFGLEQELAPSTDPLILSYSSP